MIRETRDRIDRAARKAERDEKRRREAIDALIAHAIKVHCDRIPIRMLDIPTVYKAGYAAALKGEDAGAAAVARYLELRTT